MEWLANNAPHELKRRNPRTEPTTCCMAPLTRDASNIPVNRREREGLECRLAAGESKERQEMPHAPLARIAGAISRSTNLTQILDEAGHLLFRTAAQLSMARPEMPVCLEKGDESAQAPSVTRISVAPGKVVVRCRLDHLRSKP